MNKFINHKSCTRSNETTETRDPDLTDMLQKGIKLHKSGDLDAAANIYNKILEQHSDNIDTISLLGTLNLQTGNLDTARYLFEKLIKLKPDNAIAHNNLGSVFQLSKRFNEAIISYKQAILLKHDYDEAYYNLGNAFQSIGQLDDAIANYRHAIALNPDDADVHSNLANALRKNKKPEEALVSYKQATKLMPLNAELHNNLGAALQEQNKFDEAVLSCRQAVILNPKLAKAHNNLGTALKKKHKLEDAIKCFNKAIELKTDYAEAYYNLGSALHTSGNYIESVNAYKRAITIKPDYAKAHYNLGNAMKKLNNLDEAVIRYKHAIKIKPDYVMAYNNLGTILQEQGKINEAAECYSRAIKLKPDYAEAHLNKALTSLLNGNLESGWQEYEWRLQTKNYAFRKFNFPMWDGKPLNGKNILIHTEQGFGDTIQFIRYLPMVQAQGGYVTFECPENLICLLKNYVGIDKIIEKKTYGKLSKHFDFHVPLLSLPGIFGTTLDSIPSQKQYISVNPDLIDQWRTRLNDDHKFKIGIVWAGNPNHKKDHNRSCSLNDFASLSEIPEITFYSLQKGQASFETNNPPDGMKIINIETDLHDFTDTAAVILNLDLVISVDTAVAHLAGAIGKPIWTLLPFVPDWRWLLNRSDSPWYPGMRLFRQTQPDDWIEVFKQVKDTLTQRISDCGRQKISYSKFRNLNVINSESEIHKPTISLCMIVKNEEDNLARCLDSTMDIVDEIIIVDTGSTDSTIEIAESYGARVFNHPWEGNFSKARNYSLKHATCDWILILDADEELNNDDIPIIKEVTENNDCLAVSFIIKNKYKNSTQEGYAQMVRLFKNSYGIYYKGIVHNTIHYSGKCLYSSIKIIHHGYNLSEDKMEEKFLRTSTLLKKQLESDPHNPVPYMYIGVAYLDRRMYEDAIINSKRAIHLAEANGLNKKDFLVSYYIVSAAYFEKKEFKCSEIFALMSVELDNQFLDGYCLLAFTYYNLKEYKKFMEASGKYLVIHNSITNSFSEKISSSLHHTMEQAKLENETLTNIIYHTIGHKWKIHLLRGFYYLSNNMQESGDTEIDKAINESTEMKDCLTLLGKFYIEKNEIDKAEDTYRRLLGIDDKSVNALFNLGRIRFKKDDLNETLSFWKKAVEIKPTSFDIRLLICKVNSALGNFEDIIVDCDQLLQILNMPRKITIESLSDLGNVFNSISEKLKERNEVQAAETAYRISKELKQSESIDTSCVSTNV